jgi:hypothetical protein
MKMKLKYTSTARALAAHTRNTNPPSPGLLALACLSILMLSGCAAKSLRVDYKKYEDANAQSSNRQMLLNLARLNQHHPTYFFKIGQITTNYRWQAGINGNGTYSPVGYPAGAGGGGTPNLLYEKDPNFTFIPVNDDQIAQQLLKPMPPEYFYLLFQQGWRVDQLMRLMVDHIEYTDPSDHQLHVIRNDASATNETYWTFLRICALTYHLQRRGHLVLSADQKFVPLISGLQLSDAKTAPQAKDITDALAKNLVWKQMPKQQASNDKESKPGDVRDKDSKKDSKEADEARDTWQLGQMVAEPKFKLTPAYKKATPGAKGNTEDYQIEIDMPELVNVLSLDPTLQILDSNGLGFGILEASKSADSAVPQTCAQQSAAATKSEPCLPGSAQLVMRSLIGMMAAAAQEQDGFDDVMTALNTQIELCKQDPIPAVELQPLLSIHRNRREEPPLTPVLVRLDYMDRKYLVADPMPPDPESAKRQADARAAEIKGGCSKSATDPNEVEKRAAAQKRAAVLNASWNRDNFRIITQLASLISVDISKFPVQQILQLRTQ